MRRWVYGILVVILGASLVLAGCGQQSTTPSDGGGDGGATAPQKPTCNDPMGCFEFAPGDPIKIGYSLVLSGPYTSLGVDSKNAIEIAVEDRGGKLLGRDIQLVGEDDQCLGEGGQAAGQKLAADPQIVGVIGTNCSGAAAAEAPIISKAGKVMISPSATSPSLTDPNRGPDYAGFFRTAHNDKIQGAVAARWAYEVMGFKKAATIHDGDPYTEGLATVFADTFEQLGGTVTNREAVNKGDTDMKPVLARIAPNAPDIVFFPIFTSEAAFVTAQARDIPELANAALMTADGAYSQDYVQAAGQAVVGVYQSSPDLTAMASGYAEFLQKHEAKFGGPPPSTFHAHAYDATNMLFMAIEQVAIQGEDGTLLIPQQGLRDALHGIKGYQGLTGSLTCDQYGDCADPKIAIYQQNEETLAGKWEPGVAPAKVYPQN